ncbi:MAG TPA: disulfide isomerase DsbC N-terminal domain-containing protein, partial [Vicinamibacterales bacterium]|nr:disulfide isomerase DsbC N-terminal domain-containing protein [Vicinamibacterales bacterium]
MNRSVAAFALLASVTALASPQVSKQTQDRFRALYPNIPATGFESSPVAGLVEVRTQKSVFYFAQDSGLLLLGELFNPAGESLTGQRRDAWATNRQIGNDEPTSTPGLPATGALQVRDGTVDVTAYLDVHCGACAQAVHWLVDQNGLPGAALSVVFVSRSEQDRALAEHVFCAPKRLRVAALQQVFSRKPLIEPLRCEKGRVEARA